jgi:hypothetical protein
MRHHLLNFLSAPVLALKLVGAFFCLAAVASWFAILVTMVATTDHRRPDAPLRSRWENPFNVVFTPEKLTPKGLAWRRRLGWAVAGFLISMLGGFAVGMLIQLMSR